MDDFKVKVPWFVTSNDQSVWVLFAFIRRVYINYDIRAKEGLNFYTSDIVRILDCEDKDLRCTLGDHIIEDTVTIANFYTEHSAFYFPKGIIRDTQTKELTDPRAIRVWCYLMGCLNNEMIDPRTDFSKRAPYVLHQSDREFFPLTNRKYG